MVVGDKLHSVVCSPIQHRNRNSGDGSTQKGCKVHSNVRVYNNHTCNAYAHQYTQTHTPGPSGVFRNMMYKELALGDSLGAPQEVRRKWAGAELMSPSPGAHRAPETESYACVGMKGSVGCSGWSCWRPWSDVESLSPKGRRRGKS